MCAVEIERKFIIKMPSVECLRSMPDYTVSEIRQDYLVPEDTGATERVRMRARVDSTRYYHTVKRRIDEMSCIEDEREIDGAEYRVLLARRDERTRTIEKTRHIFSFGDFTVEIDKYKGWDNIAALEVELPSRDATLTLPAFIEILFEATGNFAFSNACLAEHFPTEEDVRRLYL